MTLVHGVVAILACQLVGEVVVQLLGLPVPGPVIGLVVLFVTLLLRGGPAAPVRTVAETLLRYLALLFVPAGVGLMAHFPLIARDWLALAVALVVSTALTLIVTLLVLNGMLRHRSHD